MKSSKDETNYHGNNGLQNKKGHTNESCVQKEQDKINPSTETSESQKQENIQKVSKKIFWVGCFSPSHRNLGDQGQTLAIEKFLAKHFSDFQVKRFYRPEIEKFFKESINPSDLIFIHSSGDFGNLYHGWHQTRKRIIETYPNNRVVQLPVSVHYTSAAGFELDKIFFADKPNVLVLCRTLESAELLKRNLGCRVEFFPDFVFNLKLPIKRAAKRAGCLGVFRNDSESLFRRRLPKRVEGLLRGPLRRVRRWANYVLNLDNVRRLRKRFPDCLITDTQVSSVDIDDSNREKLIQDCLEVYTSFEKIVSDRFHGLVFSFLAKTPFVAIKSRIPHKCTIYPFLKQEDYDSYFEGFRDLVFAEKAADEQEQVFDGKEGSVFELILNRRSIRKWIDKPVEAAKLQRLVKAGVFAPSAANLQATRFKILNNKKDVEFVCGYTSYWFKHSFPGAAILVFYDSSKLPSDKWTNRFIYQDTSCAMINMMLVAEELGLKTCWATVNPNQEKTVKAKFGVSSSLVLSCMLFVGYSNQKIGLSSRHQGRKIERSVDRSLLP